MVEKEVPIANQSGKTVVKKTTSASKTVAESGNVGSASAASTVESNAHKPVASSSKSSTSNSALTREIALVLRDLNNNLNAQNARLDKQEKQLETLATQFADYGAYDCDNQSDQENICEDPPCSEVSVTPEQDVSGKNNVFRCLIDKFQQVESVDADVNEDLALFVNNSFRNGLSEDKQEEIVRDIHRPQNCESLTKTRVNQGIWRLLKMNTQADDNRMQSIQDLLVKSTANIVKLVDKNGEKLDEEDMNWASNAIALLGQVNKLINTRRKELHKSDLDPKYHYLASSSLPYTDLLYGNDTDVNKNVKEINDLNKIGRNIGRGFSRGTYRGGYGARRPHPYRRGFRGRGFRGRPDQLAGVAPSGKNFKLAPKK